MDDPNGGFASKSPRLTLFFWSLLGVFSQLAFVRMFTTLAGGTSYFGNIFFLIGIFSMAAGFFARKLSRYLVVLPSCILLAFLGATWLNSFNLIDNIPGEFFWSSIANLYPKEADFDLQLAILVLAVLTAPVMMLIGSAQARCLLDLQKGFQGYLVMATGGIAGALVFAFQNQRAPALITLLVLWAMLVIVSLLPIRKGITFWSLALAPLLALVVIGAFVSKTHFWSPYQRIDLVASREVQPSPALNVLSNGFYIFSISRAHLEDVPRESRLIKSLAFSSVRPEDKVLILGSGGGTADVREAVFAGAGQVNAVEIDGKFVDLGLTLDPDRTYADPRVNVVVDDARKYLSQTDEKFDIIYYPFLDSQTNTSNFARFRLDSFLYTREGLALAYSRLRDHGVLFIHFYTATEWIRYRIYHTLETATRRRVRAFLHPGSPWMLYAVTEQDRPLDFLREYYVDVTAEFEKSGRTLIPTDDWPFLYSARKAIPMEHLRLLFMVLILMTAILSISQGLGNSIPPPVEDQHPPDFSRGLLFYSFFSGAAFFFIELRTIAAMTPVLGSSYRSQAAVVIAIILSSLLGSLAASGRRKIGVRWMWGLLLASLVLCFMSRAWFHPLDGTLAPSILLYIAAYILPTFIAGYLYLSYLYHLSPEQVLRMQKWNCLGGAIGGLCESLVIVMGFQQSLWIGFALYTAAFIFAIASSIGFIRSRLHPGYTN